MSAFVQLNLLFLAMSGGLVMIAVLAWYLEKRDSKKRKSHMRKTAVRPAVKVQ